MAASATGNRDDSPRLPPLSLGLSSVRFIVNKLEAECARVTSNTVGTTRELVKYDPNVDEGYDDYDDSPLVKSRGQVWNRFAVNLGLSFSRCIPSVTLGNFGVLALTTGLFAPKMITYLVVYPFCRLVFGTLYPAYASYKAVRTKNLKEYVKWMMYWIVFALFTCTETFTDMFLSWFPFYYEVKIVLVLWLLSPATKGSSILYRKFVHPALCRREQEIDEYIAKAKDQGYHTVLNLGTKGVNYATTVIMQTAIKNLNLPSSEQEGARVRQAIKPRDVTDYHDTYEDLEYQHSEDNAPGIVEIVELDDEHQPLLGDGDSQDPDYEPELTSARSRGNVIRKRKVVKEKRPRSRSRGRRTRSQAVQEQGGGGLVQQLRKSYSLSDLTECEPREERGSDEADDVLTEPRVIRRSAKSGYVTRRSASESNSRSPMYFPEVDVDVRPRPRSDEPDFSHIKSSEDISSGYSSADNSGSLTRTASLGAAARARSRTSRTTVTSIKRPQAAEESEVIIEELQDDDNVEYLNMPPLINAPSPLFLSHTQPPFIYQYVGDQVKILQVLGNYPLFSSSNTTNDSDNWDQTKAQFEEALSKQTKPNETGKGVIVNTLTDDFDDAVSEMSSEKKTSTDNIGNDDRLKQSIDNTHSETHTTDQNQEDKNDKATVSINYHENTSLDQSLHENESETESDDEASFGTPENSPKYKRKSPKGKYGKAKAPPPPGTDKKESFKDVNKENDTKSEGNSQFYEITPESLVDIISKATNSKQEPGSLKHLSVNPIAENKRRHKSKSPGRTPKSGSSGLGKLLQLPSRLAFWNKADDKPKPDDTSVPSRDVSRSSTVDRFIDEFQSCIDLNTVSNDVILTDDIIIEKTREAKSEDISKDIKDKSDALQKLIDAKLETHPEYKVICLHEDMPGASKSTDV